MKRFFESKTVILILGVLSILVIIYLIASLGSLDLKPAKPFTYLQEFPALSPGWVPTWNGYVYVYIIFVALIIILFFLLPADLRKKYLRALAWLVLAGIVVFLILSQVSLGQSIVQEQDTPYGMRITRAAGPTETLEPPVTPAIFTPPEVSSWTSYLVALVFLLVLAGIGGWLLWQRRKIGAPYNALAEIAQAALDDIEAGKDWGDAILNSYHRMNRVVAGWRGIHRRESMTPAEFADYLVSTHLPSTAVYRLTALFERVRYGDKRATHKDIEEAVECLTAILEYCQAAK